MKRKYFAAAVDAIVLLFFAATARFFAAIFVATARFFAVVVLVATAISVIVVVIGLVVGAVIFLSTMWFFLSSARITDIRAVSCLANGPNVARFARGAFFMPTDLIVMDVKSPASAPALNV